MLLANPRLHSSPPFYKTEGFTDLARRRTAHVIAQETPDFALFQEFSIEDAKDAGLNNYKVIASVYGEAVIMASSSLAEPCKSLFDEFQKIVNDFEKELSTEQYQVLASTFVHFKENWSSRLSAAEVKMDNIRVILVSFHGWYNLPPNVTCDDAHRLKLLYTVLVLCKKLQDQLLVPVVIGADTNIGANERGLPAEVESEFKKFKLGELKIFSVEQRYGRKPIDVFFCFDEWVHLDSKNFDFVDDELWTATKTRAKGSSPMTTKEILVDKAAQHPYIIATLSVK